MSNGTTELIYSYPCTSETHSRSGRTSAALHWYLVHCKPREDSRALENLERQGYHCFRPMRQARRIRGKQPRQTGDALFPGYVFVQLDSVNDNWYPISSTRGVHRIVRFDSHPLPVPDKVIEGIRARIAGNEIIEPYLKPGERVELTDGPFAQIEAIFVAEDGDERVILLLNILQQEQKLSFPVESVRKLA